MLDGIELAAIALGAGAAILIIYLVETDDFPRRSGNRPW